MERGNQEEYNRILDDFDGKNKTKKECVEELIKHGYTNKQAQNAVHVYKQGGKTKAQIILKKEERNEILDGIGAENMSHKEIVDYLMKMGYTYHQSKSASYKYRLEKGLVKH